MSAAGDMLISSWKSIGMKVAGMAISMRQEEMQANLANARYDFNAPYEAEPSVIHIGNICKASFYNGARMNLRAEDLLQIK